MTHLYTITVLNLQARAHTRIGISPKEAARLDPEAFLQFAEEVARVARKLAETATGLETPTAQVQAGPQAREPKQLTLLQDELSKETTQK